MLAIYKIILIDPEDVLNELSLTPRKLDLLLSSFFFLEIKYKV